MIGSDMQEYPVGQDSPDHLTDLIFSADLVTYLIHSLVTVPDVAPMSQDGDRTSNSESV